MVLYSHPSMKNKWTLDVDQEHRSSSRGGIGTFHRKQVVYSTCSVVNSERTLYNCNTRYSDGPSQRFRQYSTPILAIRKLLFQYGFCWDNVAVFPEHSMWKSTLQNSKTKNVVRKTTKKASRLGLWSDRSMVQENVFWSLEVFLWTLSKLFCTLSHFSSMNQLSHKDWRTQTIKLISFVECIQQWSRIIFGLINVLSGWCCSIFTS